MIKPRYHRYLWSLFCYFLFLLFITGMITSGCSSSKTSASTIITQIDGNVQIKKAGTQNWQQAEIGTMLFENDSVKTNVNSKATITFFDGSIITLNPETQVEIKELVKEGTTSIRLKQELGTTLNKIEKLVDAASRYEIETPAAIAGVRGSQMRVTVAADGMTTVQNIEGKIFVTARDKEIIIPEGGTSIIIPGEPPGPAFFSAVNSFNTASSNPNGNWAYGWMSVDFNDFQFYTSHASDVFSGYAPIGLVNWYEELGKDRTPCVWINTGNTAYGVPTGWLALHPGPGSEPSVIRWTSPIAGGIHIIGEFLPGDTGKMTVTIRHNNQEIWTASDSGTFDLTVTASIGDRIDFMVYGGYWSGNTPVNITINY